MLWPPDAKNWLLGKDPDAGKDWMQEKKGMTQDEMVGWHHWLDGHEFVKALGVGDGQGNLEGCSPWGRSVGHDWESELNWMIYVLFFFTKWQGGVCCFFTNHTNTYDFSQKNIKPSKISIRFYFGKGGIWLVQASYLLRLNHSSFNQHFFFF